MPKRTTSAQVTPLPPAGRRRSQASLVYRVNLPVSGYELDCLREIASRHGILRRVATREGAKPQENFTGAPLLRTMSLEAVVAEYEKLRAAGEVKD